MHIHHVAMKSLPEWNDYFSKDRVPELSHADTSSLLTWQGVKPAPNNGPTTRSTRYYQECAFPERLAAPFALGTSEAP